jgi:hypothetical protein
MSDAKTLAFDGLVLQGLVGSTAHGTGLPGYEDTDLMGICLEPQEYVLGLEKFENYIHRTAPEGVPSGPDDTDLTIYSARKWARLAWKGNPSVLVLLFSPDFQIEAAPWSSIILDSHELYVSKEAGMRFLGYMHSQREKLLGHKHNRVQRPELVEKFGYDTKFAMHMLRLGIQGVEYLTTGHMNLPMLEEHRELLLGVRRGELTKDTCVEYSYAIEKQLRAAIDSDRVPKHADPEPINSMLVELHQTWWEARL